MSLDIDLKTEHGYVFSANITHNLTTMANQAGIYKALWRPEELGITKAIQLIPYLEQGLTLMVCNKSMFEQYNPVNGWGTWKGFVIWCADLLQACRDYPDAEISVDR